MPLTRKSSFYYWLVAIVTGTTINMSLFLFLPALGKTEPPPPPQIIEMNFVAWQQPVQQKITKPKVVPPKPKKVVKPKPRPKPKPKPKKKKPVAKVKPKPTPKPVLSESVIPDKTSQAPVPQETIEEIEEPIVSNFPVPKDAVVSEDALPVPVPIFQLSTLPRMLHRQVPEYPPAMKEQGKEGTVKLEVLLDIKGRIRNVTVIRSAGKLFDDAAVAAIKNSSFAPANVDGKPVAVLMKIPVKFRLR